MLQQNPSARRSHLLWWLLAGVVLLAAAAFAADRWLLREPAKPMIPDATVTEAELAAQSDDITLTAAGSNYTVQRFKSENCTLSVQIGEEAVFGVSRSKDATLSFFFSSLVQDLSAARALDVQFGTAAPMTLLVLGRLNIAGAPVLLLEVPADIDRLWAATESLTVSDGDTPIGRFALGEAQTKAPAMLADCVSKL